MTLLTLQIATTELLVHAHIEPNTHEFRHHKGRTASIRVISGAIPTSNKLAMRTEPLAEAFPVTLTWSLGDYVPVPHGHAFTTAKLLLSSYSAELLTPANVIQTESLTRRRTSVRVVQWSFDRGRRGRGCGEFPHFVKVGDWHVSIASQGHCHLCFRMYSGVPSPMKAKAMATQVRMPAR